jgi:hypothetical protein
MTSKKKHLDPAIVLPKGGPPKEGYNGHKRTKARLVHFLVFMQRSVPFVSVC